MNFKTTPNRSSGPIDFSQSRKLSFFLAASFGVCFLICFAPSPVTAQTATFTTTATNTATYTPTNTLTFAVTATNTPTNTLTPTSTATNTNSPTLTSAFTPTVTNTPTGSATPTPIFTFTPTATPGGCDGTFSAYVYPNPATGNKATFSYSLCEPGPVNIFVYNAAGDLVATYPTQGVAGGNTLAADISPYSHGIYYYRLKGSGSSGESRSKTNKFAVIRYP